MANVNKPASFALARVSVRYRTSSVMSSSPYNFTQQVYSWKGKIKIVQIEVPAMEDPEAQQWTQFLDDLDGHVNTFTMDLSDLYPHESGIGAVAMRLADPEQVWSADAPFRYGFSFTAIEAL